MKVTVCFGDVRVIVPCGDGSFSVQELLDRSVTRYRKAASKSKETYVHVRALKSSDDGGIFDLDDSVADVVDDREQIIAVYEERTRPSQVIDGAADRIDKSPPTLSPVFQTNQSNSSNHSHTHAQIAAGPVYRPPNSSQIRPANPSQFRPANNFNLYTSTGPQPFRKASNDEPLRASPVSYQPAVYTEVTHIDVQQPKSKLTVRNLSDSQPENVKSSIPPPPPPQQGYERLRLDQRPPSQDSLDRPNFSSTGSEQSDTESQIETELQPFHQRIKTLEVALGSIHKNKIGKEDQGSRREPLGQCGSPEAEHSPQITPQSEINEKPRYSTPQDPQLVILHNTGGPLGIHVVPYQDEITGTEYYRIGQGGLVIHEIEPRGRVSQTGLISINDIITEINGRSLLNASFDRAQEIFRDALLTEEIRIKVKKPPPSAQGLFSSSSSSARLVNTAGSAESVPMVTQQSQQPNRSAYKSHGDLRSSSKDKLPRFTSNAPTVAVKKAPVPTKLASPPAEITQLLPSASQTRRKKLYIDLVKGPEGLGFSITSRDNNTSDGVTAPIYVKNILPKGAAIKDGNLSSGDQLLEVNGVSMIGKSQEEAVVILRNMKRGSVVCLCVSRLDTPTIDPNLPRQLNEEHPEPTAPPLPTSSYNANHEPMSELKDRQLEILNIPLNETGSAGLGISVKGKTTTINGIQKDLGIFIKAVIHGGAASKDGRLRVNDQLLAVNNIDMRSLSNGEAMDTLRDAMQSEGPTPGHIKLCISRKLGTFGEEDAPILPLDAIDSSSQQKSKTAPNIVSLNSQNVGTQNTNHHNSSCPPQSSGTDVINSTPSKHVTATPGKLIDSLDVYSNPIGSERSNGSSLDLLMIEEDSYNTISHHHQSSVERTPLLHSHTPTDEQREDNSHNSAPTEELHIMTDSFDRKLAGRQSFSEKRGGSSRRGRKGASQTIVEQSVKTSEEGSSPHNPDEPNQPAGDPVFVPRQKPAWRPTPAPRKSVHGLVPEPEAQPEAQPEAEPSEIIKAVTSPDFTPSFYLTSFLHRKESETRRKRFSDASIQYDPPTDTFTDTRPDHDYNNQRPVKLLRRSSSLETLPRKYKDVRRDMKVDAGTADPLNVSMTASIYCEPHERKQDNGAAIRNKHKTRQSGGFLGIFKRSKSKMSLNDETLTESETSEQHPDSQSVNSEHPSQASKKSSRSSTRLSKTEPDNTQYKKSDRASKVAEKQRLEAERVAEKQRFEAEKLAEKQAAKLAEKQRELAEKERKKSLKEQKHREKEEKKFRKKSKVDKDEIEEARRNHIAEQERIAEEYKKLRIKESQRTLSQEQLTQQIPVLELNSHIRTHIDQENSISSRSYHGEASYERQSASDTEWKKQTVWV